MLSHYGLPPRNKPKRPYAGLQRASDARAALPAADDLAVGAVTRQRRTSFWISAVAGFAVVLGCGVSPAQETTLSPEALREIAKVEAEIDRIEVQTLERLVAPPDNQVQQTDRQIDAL
jgi:hypothetical protein